MWRSILHCRTSFMQHSSLPQIHHLKSTNFVIPKFNFIHLPRFFSSESDSSDQNPNPNSSTPTTTPEIKVISSDIEDVSNEEDIKKVVQAKHDELGEKLERNELGADKAYEQFKVFEDEILAEHITKDEEERLREPEEVAALPVDNKSDDPPGVGPALPVDNKSGDPPGVGPILRWQSRLYFISGGDAWHPKNRKVKLSVTVKELGLTKYQFRRMREIVGKRYHSGKDELTITSERYEHREENRKDCLRTLLSIIEEAGKADALVEEARTAYVKQRLKANPAFMARLHAKTKQAPALDPS